MAIRNHAHKLRKHVYKTGSAVFFCTLPDCNFKSEPQFLVGKNSICNKCGAVFEITDYSIKLHKPHCANCNKIKIKGPDGKGHFVEKSQLTDEVMSGMAKDETQSLRDRLTNITEAEEDI